LDSDLLGGTCDALSCFAGFGRRGNERQRAIAKPDAARPRRGAGVLLALPRGRQERRSPHVGAPPFRTFSRSFDLDQFAQHLERGISSNHPDMPEFKFSEQDARDVSAYLRRIQR
jgi:hypothetical protein